jgi:hypothetical protein
LIRRARPKSFDCLQLGNQSFEALLKEQDRRNLTYSNEWPVFQIASGLIQPVPEGGAGPLLMVTGPF